MSGSDEKNISVCVNGKLWKSIEKWIDEFCFNHNKAMEFRT